MRAALVMDIVCAIHLLSTNTCQVPCRTVILKHKNVFRKRKNVSVADEALLVLSNNERSLEK